MLLSSCKVYYILLLVSNRVEILVPDGSRGLIQEGQVLAALASGPDFTIFLALATMIVSPRPTRSY